MCELSWCELSWRVSAELCVCSVEELESVRELIYCSVELECV